VTNLRHPPRKIKTSSWPLDIQRRLKTRQKQQQLVSARKRMLNKTILRMGCSSWRLQRERSVSRPRLKALENREVVSVCKGMMGCCLWGSERSVS
jgi:hypothetical protein